MKAAYGETKPSSYLLPSCFLQKKKEKRKEKTHSFDKASLIVTYNEYKILKNYNFCEKWEQ